MLLKMLATTSSDSRQISVSIFVIEHIHSHLSFSRPTSDIDRLFLLCMLIHLTGKAR